METASGEVITESEKEHALAELEKLCLEEQNKLTSERAKEAAKAVFHEAVNTAARRLAESIASESAPIARRTLSKSLRKISDYPNIEQIVIEAAEPVARFAALEAVRKWSMQKAMPAAEEAVTKTLNESIGEGARPVLKSAVLAGMRVLVSGANSNGHELDPAEREKLLNDYLTAEARKGALELLEQSMNAELQRKIQKAAETAIAEVASQATDAVARDEALKAAEAVAITTTKEEISRLILAEVQRRAAKLSREFLQEEAPKQEEAGRAKFCQEQALVLAKDAVQQVIDEVADPQVADLEIAKALELASSAASAVAREYSGAYEFTRDNESMSPQTIAILAVQIGIGCVLIWFFLLGGYDICKPGLRSILPAQIFHVLYPAPPVGKIPGNVDELVEDGTPGESEDKATPANDLQGNESMEPVSPQDAENAEKSASPEQPIPNSGEAQPSSESPQKNPEATAPPAPSADSSKASPETDTNKSSPEAAGSADGPGSDRIAPDAGSKPNSTPPTTGSSESK